MLLSCSANRAKSWSFEHCENCKSLKKRELCFSCYWAYPETHTHIALKPLRRIDLLWQGEDTAHYDQLKANAQNAGLELPAFVKAVLREAGAK